MACSTSTSVPGSSDEVASSSTSSAGSTSAARASETSCFSPALQPRAPLADLGVEPLGQRGEPVEHADGRAGPRRPRRRWRRPGRCRTLSRIVPLNRKPSWGTTTIALAQRRAAWRRAGRRRRRSPGPSTGSYMRAISLASVDLPAPVGPTSASRSPGAIVSDTSRSTGRAAGVGERRRPSTTISPLGGQVDRAGALGHVDRRVEQLEELVEAGAGRLHGVEQLAELLDRLEQVVEREHEEGDGADA